MHVLPGFMAAGEGVSITVLSRFRMYVDLGLLTAIPVAPAGLLMRKGQRLPPTGEARTRAVGRPFAPLDQGA